MANSRLVLLIFCFITVVSGAAATRSTVFKTIKTEHGDLYDCVDINKQPSLQHPALKDHKVQMRTPKEVALLTERVRAGRNRIGKAGSKVKMDPRKVCPFGHVPIRRSTIQNLTTPLTTHLEPHDDLSHERVQFAGLVANGSQIFRGAMAYLGLYNPKVGPNQISSSIVALISRDGDTFNRIEAGWTVNPSEYGDTKTRLYTSWTTDGYRSTGCFDTKCPGFIWTSRAWPPGYAFEIVSKRNKYVWDTEILIIQSFRDGSWWLIVEGDDVGYWPKEIFTTMASGAQMVKFGGEISQRGPSKRSPEMGSGTFREGFEYSTAMNRGVNVLNASALPIHPDPSFTSVEETSCYFVGDSYDRGGKDGYSFLYGGPYTPYCNKGSRGGDTILGGMQHSHCFLIFLLLFFL